MDPLLSYIFPWHKIFVTSGATDGNWLGDLCHIMFSCCYAQLDTCDSTVPDVPWIKFASTADWIPTRSSRSFCYSRPAKTLSLRAMLSNSNFRGCWGTSFSALLFLCFQWQRNSRAESELCPNPRFVASKRRNKDETIWGNYWTSPQDESLK